MKIGELKHNHSLTDLLKVLLFALLMLAPIGSVLTRSLYVVCNKNAYESYSDVNGITYTSASGQAQVYGAQYEVRYNPNGTETTYQQLNVLNNKTNALDLYGGNEEKVLNAITIERNGQSLYFYYTDSTYEEIPNWYETSATFYYVASTTTAITNTSNRFYNVYRITAVPGQLDNVFEYSVSKLATDQMFTWTQNTPVFTGIDAMCTQLGITAPAIPIIIAYWLILTCVYIVIDIVIKLITYLTHLIGARKGT